MRGGKRQNIPEGALFFLGTKPKKSLLSSSTVGSGSAYKKAKGDFIEVEPAELVSRTEAALSSGNVNLAESLVLSALNHLRTSSGPTTAAALALGSVGFRSVSGSSGGSRLPPGFCLGLLILAQAHPTLFTRAAVLDQLIALLSLSPRELGISLPPAAVATLCARARGLHVLVANLTYFAFASTPKWPSRLVKIYLEDSLMDRIWVDQDECRAFVLNLETAFPKVYGDPRGLFSVLCGPTGSTAPSAQTSSATTSSSGNNGGSSSAGVGGTGGGGGGSGGSTAVHTVLGLGPGQSNITPETIADCPEKDEIAEAVAITLRSSNTSVAKVIHGADPANLVLPRFENSRQAVEVMIVNTLREALGRRGSATGSAVVGGNGAVVTAGTGPHAGGNQSTAASGGGALSIASGSSQSGSPAVGSIEAAQLRGLIRTVAMACGIPEVRGLVAARLEPWITNPKIQMYAIGLVAILASNCRLGGRSPHDLDVMISVIFRIRYKLLKPNIQAAFLECLAHMVKANPLNLYCLIHLCAMSESRPVVTAVPTSDMKTTSGQYISQMVIKIAETVQSMSTATSADGTEDRTGKTNQQQLQLNTATIAAVAAGASNIVATRGAASVYTILPFLFQRFGAQWIRIMGNLLHERLLLSTTSTTFGAMSSALTSTQVVDELTATMVPVYAFLRELARNSRPNLTDSGLLGMNQSSSSSVPMANQPQLLQQTYLPCAELAGALLQDRNYRINTTATAAANAIIRALSSNESHASTDQPIIVGVGRIQFYLNGLIGLVCALQMLSASRPHLVGASASRRTTTHVDAMKAHQTALRQIRLAVVRWAKTILPSLVNAAMQSTSSPNVTQTRTQLLSCVDALKPSLLIRRAFMLDSNASLGRTNSIVYELPAFYPVKEIWANDQEHNLLIRLVTDTVLPEKLAHQLLILGLEPSRQLFNPLDSLDMVCELIWRAALLARDSGLEPLNVTKPQQLIDLLFASCTYVGEQDQQLPSDVTELAYASAYWRVSATTVILAAHCLQTCGLHLWTHYPTIRRLIEMVMTDDFETVSTDTKSNLDTGVEEAAQLNSQLETQLILRLESYLLNPDPNNPNSPVATVTPETSKLLGRLVRNNPRGPIRLPPAEQLTSLRAIAQELGLGRRLWRSRDPDFLLELLHSQAGHPAVQPWLVRLVESSGADFELLPIECLCEYLLRDTLTRMRQSCVHVLPLVKTIESTNNGRRQRTSSTSSDCLTTSTKESKTESYMNKSSLRTHLVAKLRESLRTFGNCTTADALAHSFFARLNNQHTWIRQAVRECLYTLTEPHTSAEIRLQDSVLDWLNVLHTLLQLPVLRAEPRSTAPAEAAQNLLSSLLDSLLVETDLNILTGSLLFLSHVTRSPSFVSWRPLITSLAQFIQSRPKILSALLHRPTAAPDEQHWTDSNLDWSYLALEALSEMHVRYVEYNCTVAGAIPVDERKSVFVTWPTERECPLELELIQAQLLLLSHAHDNLPHRIPPGVVELFETFQYAEAEPSTERCWWLRLRDTWFVPQDARPGSDKFGLPQLTPFTTELTEFPGSTMFHKVELSFEKATDANQSPRPCLSVGLRCGLICSNNLPLVSGALWRIAPDELAAVINKLPTYLLTENTARRVLHCWDAMKHEDFADGRKRLDASLLRLRHKSQLLTSAHEPMEQDGAQPEPTTDSSQSPTVDTPVKLETLEVQPEGKFWSNLMNTLDLLSDAKRSGIICQTAHQLMLDEKKRKMWLENFSVEMAYFARDGLGSPKTGRSRSRTSRSLSQSHFIRIAGSTPQMCRAVRPLVFICLRKSPQVLEKIRSTLQDVLGRSPEARCIWDNLLSGLDWNLLTPTELSNQQTVDSDNKASCEPSHIAFVDQIGQFGLVELTRGIIPLQPSNASPILDLIRAVEYVFRCSIDQSTTVPIAHVTCVEPDRTYLLRCLLQQANPDILWHVLRSLFQNTQVECFKSTQLLDFFIAVLTLPRLAYPVPRSEPRDRPDSTTALTELHQLSPDEVISLIMHIIREADQIASKSHGRVVQTIDAALSGRMVCLNVVVTQHSALCVSYLELLSGCLSLDDATRLDVQFTPLLLARHPCKSQSTALRRLTALRLLAILYQRWPGTLGLIQSPLAKAWTTQPWRIRDRAYNHSWLKAIADQCEQPLGNVDSISQPEIDRLGPLLLVSLTSSNSTLEESVQLSCKSLFVHHSRAALRLLPVLAALSEGRLGLSWAQFSGRRYHLLFAELLHLLELLVPFGTDEESDADGQSALDVDCNASSSSALFSDEAILHRSAIEHLLANMIRMLARFRHQVRKLGGFAGRISRFLESYTNCETGRQILANVFRTVPDEMNLLVTEFDELASLPTIIGFTREKGDPTVSESSSTFSFSSSTAHSGRTTRRWNVAVQPFRQRLQTSNSIQATTELLEDLDETSKRKVDVLLHFKSDLIRLISHPNESICSLSLRLLLRLMVQFPRCAPAIIESGILPYLSPKMLDQSSLHVPILESLPFFCFLAPLLAPKLLHACAETILFRVPDSSSYEALSAIEETVRRLALDGLDAACVEHAASALISRTNLIHGGGPSS